ncbi:MAG: chorismate synthase [Thermoplasmata archaeon]|nr:chorismate synthase [Thermoplasmata archaeon]
MGFGTRFQVTIFGSSHGPEVGAKISGVPAGRAVSVARIQEELDRRRPVGRRLATKRQEEDVLSVDSGISGDRTDGTPIRAHVANTDVRREPYDRIRDTPRPGHADYPARVRFGASADLAGGGIFSGRMTVGLVIAGSIARQLLEPLHIDTAAFTRAIGPVAVGELPPLPLPELRRRSAENEVGCPDAAVAEKMAEAIEAARREGDSLGGIIEAWTTGIPVGLGEPFFGSVESTLAALAFSIPAVKGVEFGDGFAAARLKGSEHNDGYRMSEGHVTLLSNHAGGILGGLATGAPLVYRVAVKPTSSISRPQRTVHLETGTDTEIAVTGRHDPCIVPRAVVVLEATTSIGLIELALRGDYLT